MTKRFLDAATDLTELCEMIDGGVDLDEQLKAEFAIALDDVVAAVERRKYFLAEINSKIDLAKSKKEEIEKAIKTFENLRTRVISTTKYVVEQNPNIPFKDSLGKKLHILKNPSPTLKVTEGWESSDYAKIVNSLQLDKKKLKEDLINGSKVEFATIEYGTHLRGLK